MATVAALGLASGCVDSSPEAAKTPEAAPTVANSAVQTDSEGRTVTAPPEPRPAGETDTIGAPEPVPGGAPPAGGAGGGGGEEAGGNPAAGQQVFAANCTSCHLNNGQDAGGVGPQLAGGGLEADFIRETVINGRGPMPAGLVDGEELENVVAYVVSIQ